MVTIKIMKVSDPLGGRENGANVHISFGWLANIRPRSCPLNIKFIIRFL